MPRLWFFSISSTKDKLVHLENHFVIWYPSSKLTDDIKNENDMQDEEDSVKNDYTKMYSREITLSVFQQDDVEYLENVAIREQKLELYEKLVIVCGIWRPKSTRKDCIEEFLTSNKLH